MEKRKEIITKSADETRKLGKKFARSILKTGKNKKAVVLALKGDLGAGKTTFLQGFAMGLGVKERVLSPTFVIMKKFSRNAGSRYAGHVSRQRRGSLASPAKRGGPEAACPKFQEFYHIDCYRIKNSKEIFDLGFKEIISNPKNIIAIEWPERIKKILPKNSVWINFEFINEQTRKITVKKN